MQLLAPQGRFDLVTDSGTFSPKGVDVGTRVLLQVVPMPVAGGVVADVGCGYGPIAVAIAAAAPAAEIWAIDVNERALALCRENAEANGLHNVRTVTPDDVPDSLRVDAVYTNPPVRIGKQALYNLLHRWLERLRPGGVMYLVMQRHLGSDSLASRLTERGFRVRRLASRQGYRVLEVRVDDEERA